MLRITEGNPWVMWPDSLVENFIPDPANKILDYNGNFDFKITFELPKLVKQKSTLFSKLPSYFGVDIEEYGLTFIVTENPQHSKYKFGDYSWKVGETYELIIQKKENTITLSINGVTIIKYQIETTLSSDSISHIIFGAGNFPKNNFNLNYIDVILHQFEIIKEGTTLSLHKFETFIHNKSFDETGNCNFIHKI